MPASASADDPRAMPQLNSNSGRAWRISSGNAPASRCSTPPLTFAKPMSSAGTASTSSGAAITIGDSCGRDWSAPWPPSSGASPPRYSPSKVRKIARNM